LNTKKRIGQRIQALCTSQNTGYINNTVTAHLMSLFQHWKKIISSALPAFGLVIGLFAIHSWQSQELITDIADVDAILLADDLPPEAYKDPGFAEFISKSENIQESFPSSE
jgi:hypothetical protein